ncbi:hypothetical protein [Aquibacillus halophilus]|nr:hypothetical protein [Aquibacillus halophilus]
MVRTITLEEYVEFAKTMEKPFVLEFGELGDRAVVCLRPLSQA